MIELLLDYIINIARIHGMGVESAVYVQSKIIEILVKSESIRELVSRESIVISRGNEIHYKIVYVYKLAFSMFVIDSSARASCLWIGVRNAVNLAARNSRRQSAAEHANVSLLPRLGSLNHIVLVELCSTLRPPRQIVNGFFI